MRHVPEAVSLYEQLGVKKAPLSLIPPAFETPLPSLTPATFPPVLREPPPPALELFDLDEAFAGEQVSVFGHSLAVFSRRVFVEVANSAFFLFCCVFQVCPNHAP